jgi:hypothetical protein
MDNPPRAKNCHFLEITEDDMGPHNVSIQYDKIFDEDAQWKYLEDMLENKVVKETSEWIVFAHQRLPELFRQIKTESIVTSWSRHAGFRWMAMRQYVQPSVLR